MQKINPCLWFEDQAEQAANLYVSLFEDSAVTHVSRFPEGSPGPAGQAMMVNFTIAGQEFLGLNGRSALGFTEAVSFSVHCKDQAEVDRLWERLTDGGEEGQCGWLKDRFGVSWQIIPDRLGELLGDPDPARSHAVMLAMQQMGKIDIQALEDAADTA